MGVGFNRMNNVVVQQTTQGFCRYLQQQNEQKLSARGVVIGEIRSPLHKLMADLASDSICCFAWAGYDGRHDSKAFAHLAAAVFVSQGFQVHLFSEMVPTPFVAAAVTYKVRQHIKQCSFAVDKHIVSTVAIWWLMPCSAQRILCCSMT